MLDSPRLFHGLDHLIRDWQSSGVIPSGPRPTIRQLIDIFRARVQFLLAVERETTAWADLANTCRDFHVQGLDVLDDDADPKGDRLSRSQRDARDEWLRIWNVDAPWMKEWAGRAMGQLGEYFFGQQRENMELVTPSLEMILEFEAEGTWPLPEGFEVLNACTFESDYELVPWPGLETLDEWLERARIAYLNRVQETQLADSSHASTRPVGWKASMKHLPRNAEWFARFQVRGERVVDIVASAHAALEELDQRSVERALTDFARLIDMKKRTV